MRARPTVRRLVLGHNPTWMKKLAHDQPPHSSLLSHPLLPPTPQLHYILATYWSLSRKPLIVPPKNRTHVKSCNRGQGKVWEGEKWEVGTCMMCVCVHAHWEDTYKTGGKDGSDCTNGNGFLCILQIPRAIRTSHDACAHIREKLCVR